jgi:hypothetical protein
MTDADRAHSRAGRVAAGAVIAALALLVGALPASGEPAASIIEYPIAGSANPDLIAPGLASDPGSSGWVTDRFAGPTSEGRIYRVDAGTGGVSGTFPPTDRRTGCDTTPCTPRPIRTSPGN